MPESEARTATDGVDCSGATEAESKFRAYIQQRLEYRADGNSSNQTATDVQACRELHQVIKAFDAYLVESAVADDAGESGVQETERSLLDEAINCLRARESLLNERVRKYRCGNGPEWIADMWGNRHEETGMCVNELVKLKQNLQAKPNNTDKGLDARRSEVS